MSKLPSLPKGLLCLSLIALAGACSSSEKTEDAAPPTAAADTANVKPAPKDWQAKMHSLSATLSSLMPMIASKAKFNDPKNAATIEAETTKLKALSHSLKTGSKPNSDPSMAVVSELLDEDIERALEGLRSGNRDYARDILKDTTSYCIQCHTQTNNGPEFPRLELAINTNELSTLDQAQFFAATRQFDRALEAYEKALSDPKLAKADPFEWEQAARSALAIVVRVKKDPKETSRILSQIEVQKALPVSTKTALKAWKASVQEWAKEKPTPTRTNDQVLAKAEELIKRAQKRQEFPLDHSQDVLFFRAGSLIHDVLEDKGRPPELSARALYSAGIAAEATRDMSFWTLHETYYEQCIRAVPHTAQAEKCFARLRDSVTLGYSGSGGLRLPPEVKRRLERFEALAKPEAPKNEGGSAEPPKTGT